MNSEVSVQEDITRRTPKLLTSPSLERETASANYCLVSARLYSLVRCALPLLLRHGQEANSTGLSSINIEVRVTRDTYIRMYSVSDLKSTSAYCSCAVVALPVI